MTKRYALNAVFKRTVLGKYRRRSMSNMNFAEYKTFVEGTRVADAGGIWKIVLSDIAKYPEEIKIAYKYFVSYHSRAGQIPFVSVHPPLKVRSARKDMPAFDDRVQLSHEDLLAMIVKAKRVLVMN
jgi:hypothetical protein